MYTRRRFLRLAPGTLGALAGCAAPTRTTPTPDRAGDGWRTFRGDERNTGCVPGANGPTEKPAVEWTATTDGPVWSSPVVADGTLYIGSNDRHLHAIDAATGETEWRFETGGPIEGTPAVEDGTVYVGSLDKRVYALDAATGETEWERETAGFVLSSPAIDGDTLYIGSGTILAPGIVAYREAEDRSQEGGGVYALDKHTGEVRWRALPDTWVVSSPAVDDEAVYVGGAQADPRIHALNKSDGSWRWWYGGPTDFVLGSPTVHDGTVYVGDFDRKMWAIDTTTANVTWEVTTEGNFIYGSPAVCGGTLYIGVSGTPSPDPPNARVYALSLADGATEWIHKFDEPLTGSSPAVTDDAIYMGTHTQVTDPEPPEGVLGGFYGVSLEGDRRWKYPVEGGEGIGSSPALVGDTLYFGADNTRVYAMA